MVRKPVMVVALLAGLLLVSVESVGAAVLADPVPPMNQVAPVVSGAPQVGAVLQASRGTWTPEPTSYSFRWLRDAVPIPGAHQASYRLVGADRGHRLSVAVTATTEVPGLAAVSAETSPVGFGQFEMSTRPRIEGIRRWGRTLRVSPGAWSPAPTRVSYQWFRGSRPIRGATKAKYTVRVADFAQHLQVRVLLRRPDYAPGIFNTPRTKPIGHRVKVRKRFTYSIATRGRITASLKKFSNLSAQSFADPRGWRAAGYEFKRVARGGDFTLVLAAAETLPSFGSPCSSTWSCRVGRYVIINQTRWRFASPAWNAAGLSLRGYRHMVLNHETGHWLGHRHSSCPGPGKLAPVMMQQSKGRDGCRFNPFPLASERWTSH